MEFAKNSLKIYLFIVIGCVIQAEAEKIELSKLRAE